MASAVATLSNIERAIRKARTTWTTAIVAKAGQSDLAV